MHRFAVTTTVVVAFLVGAMTALPLGASGSPQTQVSTVLSKNVEHLAWDQRDVRDSLRELFRGTSVSYSIATDVQGEVTLDLRNVTMETALQNILRQVDAVYKVEHGVVMISRTNAPPVGDVLQPQGYLEPGARWINDRPGFGLPPSPPVIEQDGSYLYILRGNNLLKIAKKDLKVERSVTLPMP